jgi:hypothetical protein
MRQLVLAALKFSVEKSPDRRRTAGVSVDAVRGYGSV